MHRKPGVEKVNRESIELTTKGLSKKWAVSFFIKKINAASRTPLDFFFTNDNFYNKFFLQFLKQKIRSEKIKTDVIGDFFKLLEINHKNQYNPL